VAAISIIFAVIMAIGFVSRRKLEDAEHAQDADDADSARGSLWRTIAIIFGVVSPVVFLLTEDITLAITAVDMWTLLMAVFLLIQVVSAVVINQRSKAKGNKLGANY
jgi:hypothetical protein